MLPSASSASWTRLRKAGAGNPERLLDRSAVERNRGAGLVATGGVADDELEGAWSSGEYANVCVAPAARLAAAPSWSHSNSPQLVAPNTGLSFLSPCALTVWAKPSLLTTATVRVALDAGQLQVRVGGVDLVVDERDRHVRRGVRGDTGGQVALDPHRG